MLKNFKEFEYEVTDEKTVHVKGPTGEFTLNFPSGVNEEAIIASLKFCSNHPMEEKKK